MTFQEWIVQKHKGKDTPFGDLAADVEKDIRFPDKNEFSVIYEHLGTRAERRIRHKVLRTFREAWAAYAKQTGIRMPSEAEIEHKFCKRVEWLGGLALKFTPAGWSGAPDRIVLLPNGTVQFVEFKVLGAEPRPLQKLRLTQLRHMSFESFVIDSLRDVDAFIEQAESDLASRPASPDDGRRYDDMEGLFRL